MLGGAASAKTASYTLVAADAGTAISMTSTSATTITVNTGLFANGDTVQITNLGSGVATITAGTATVNTSASLALAQYESGTLDFTSTSAAIFIKGAGAAASSGGMTLISTTTLSGSSITLSSIPQTYKNLYVLIRKPLFSASGATIRVRLNADSGTRYQSGSTTDAPTVTFTNTSYRPHDNGNNTVSDGNIQIYLPDYADATTFQAFNGIGLTTDRDNTAAIYRYVSWGMYNQNTAITSLEFITDSGTFTSGTVLLYGVN
jgi:hypothetical protein